MKQISLIIPNSARMYTAGLDGQSPTRAVSHIYNYLRAYGIEYEILIVTDSLKNVTLRDIEIFPNCTPISVHNQHKQKNISELGIKGVALAKYDSIGILGNEMDYLPQIFHWINTESTDNNTVIATVKTTKVSFLPFLLKIRVNPENTALFFPKSIWRVIHFKPSKDAIFLSEFLKRSTEAGFTLKKYQHSLQPGGIATPPKITMSELISALKDTVSIFIKKMPPIYIPAQHANSMKNAGIFYKKRKYITHTTLHIENSALEGNSIHLIIFITLLIGLLVVLLFFMPLLFIQYFIGMLSGIYLIDICFNMFLVFNTFLTTPELSFSASELAHINDNKLPVYSILCPLYKEAHILPQFIKGLRKIDWPKSKLDVIILLESDDKESIKVFKTMRVPEYIRSVIVPHSVPKTKPKACNYGLAFAKGEYTVIYDAEDLPDPLQLKKAYLGFKKSGTKVACLQAKLNYYNSNQNLLTRFFTAEYSLWFDVTLTSLHALKTIIPLGGTSNHFRTNDLRKLHAWDPFNVTEDADLGLRLFKLGYTTAILDSVTLEEGNSDVGNWIRQRSRWIKGYMQTYLVHTRENYSFFRERGIHALIFHLVIGGKLAFIIINPILWIVTILYFTLYAVIGPTIDSFYPPFVLYIAITSLIFGNYLYVFCHFMGCVKKEQWSLIKYVFLIPLYWILISVAGYLALYQLFFKPFYWEKTVHGLHLKVPPSFSKTATPKLQI